MRYWRPDTCIRKISFFRNLTHFTILLSFVINSRGIEQKTMAKLSKLEKNIQIVWAMIFLGGVLSLVWDFGMHVNSHMIQKWHGRYWKYISHIYLHVHLKGQQTRWQYIQQVILRNTNVADTKWECELRRPEMFYVNPKLFINAYCVLESKISAKTRRTDTLLILI